MSEVVGDFTGKCIGATFFRGFKPIDGVWATQDIVITHATSFRGSTPIDGVWATQDIVITHATSFRGSTPIDGVWDMQDIVITHAGVMLMGFGIGDHQMFVIDVQKEKILRSALFGVKRFALCRLNTKVSNCTTQKYLTKLEEGLLQHRSIEEIGKLHE
jgi:hypothetical protein